MKNLKTLHQHIPYVCKTLYRQWLFLSNAIMHDIYSSLFSKFSKEHGKKYNIMNKNSRSACGCLTSHFH